MSEHVDEPGRQALCEELREVADALDRHALVIRARHDRQQQALDPHARWPVEDQVDVNGRPVLLDALVGRANALAAIAALT